MPIAKGLYTKVYCSAAQDDIKTTKLHAGTDAVKCLETVVFTKDLSNIVRDDYHADTRSPVATVDGNEVCSFTATLYALSSGAQGTVSDIGTLLDTIFLQSANAATTVASDMTTTEMKLTADELDVGDIGKVNVEDADGNVIERRYFYVTAKTDPALVMTITPPLTTAPTALDVIPAIVQFNHTIENQGKWVTLYRSDNVMGEMGIGCQAGKLTFTFETGQIGELGIEGLAREIIRSVHTTITDDPLTDAATTINVTHEGIEAGAVLNLIQAADASNVEQVLVGAVSGKVLSQCTRSYGADTAKAFAVGDKIGPYEPTETTAGNPIRGIYGGVWINEVQFKTTKVTLTLDEKTMYAHFFGDDGLAEVAENPEDREIIWEIELYLETAVAEHLADAVKSTSVAVFMQAGQTDGRGVAFYSPAVEFENPVLGDSKGELTKVTLTSRAVLSTSGENAIVFGY